MDEKQLQFNKENIMRRVHVTYWARRLRSRVALKLYALVILMLGISTNVSVPNVITNMPTRLDAVAIYNFLLSAVTQTEFIVQVFVAVATLFLAWIIKDSIEGYSRHARIQRA